VIAIGLQLSVYFYIAFICIVTGIILYEAGPSPADAPTGTPLAIEYVNREKKGDETISVEMTEHAGNLRSSIMTEVAGNLSRLDIDGKLT
jgi:hypothetical protein